MPNIDLITAGKEIGVSCAADTSAINTKIADFASDNNLNREQTQRLIEESNKACYLEHYRRTGQQVFDVADYNKVTEILSPDEPAMDKAASLSQQPHPAPSRALGLGIFGSPYHQRLSMQKAANDERLEHLKDINKELRDTTQKFDGWIRKIAEHDPRVRNMTYDEALEYLGKTNTKLAETLIPVYQHINQLCNDRKLLEKKALEPPKTLNGFMEQTMRAAPKTIGNTIKRKPLQHAGRVIGPKGTYIKSASMNIPLNTSFVQSLKQNAIDHAPKLVGAAVLGGLSYGAKKIIGAYTRNKERKEMEQNFQSVMQLEPEIAANPKSRSYFETISNFAPDLAKDPNTLSVLLNQFNTFDGIDLNTIKMMRDIGGGAKNEFKIKGPGGLEVSSAHKR